VTGRVEVSESFACFGSRCAVLVMGDGAAREAAAGARRRLLAWHRRFTRFAPDSELSRMNADPRHEVPVTAMMAAFAQLVVRAARETGGLVDATLLTELQRAGYDGDLRTSIPLSRSLRAAPPRAAARPSRDARWREIEVDAGTQTVRRPPGVGLDSGGLAKGLFADVLAGALSAHPGFAVDCGGDLRIGGGSRLARPVHVAGPFGDGTLHTFELREAGVATSGIGRRSWLDAGGAPGHHLLDPSTGRPAFTGVVQVTALAPTAAEAELRAKAALLGGPDGARRWLPDGGVVVYDDGGHDVIAAAGALQ
jgi:FAD:protein FMN transferase